MAVQLPEEIYDLIASHASRDTIRVMRLVCRQFNELGKRHLFRTVYLKVNLDSYQKCIKIAADDNIAYLVRELIYDPALLPWDLNSIDEYMDEGCGTGLAYVSPSTNQGMENYDERQARLVHILKPLELEHHYQQYKRLVAGQKYLHRAENECEALSDIFSKLRRLKRVEIIKFWLPEWSRPTYHYFSGASVSPVPSCEGIVAQQTLMQPRLDQHRAHRLRAVMMATWRNRTPLKRLLAGPIELIKFKKLIEEGEGTFFRGPSTLERLDLDLKELHGQLVPGAIGCLESFLSNCPKLQSLRIDLCVSRVSPGTQFPGVLKSRKWNYLRNLSLSDFQDINLTEFIEFLGLHSSSLESLGMADIVISSPVELLIFLAENMHLRELRLDRFLGMNPDESWVVDPRHAFSEARRAKLPQGAPLLERIVSYVVSGGQCPFFKEVNSSKWVAQEDRSFRDWPWALNSY